MQKPLSPEERKAYRGDIFGEPGAPQVEPHPVDYFLEKLDASRSIIRQILQKFTDADLNRVAQTTYQGKTYDYTLRWPLYHLVEHESGHRGQIRYILGLIGAKPFKVVDLSFLSVAVTNDNRHFQFSLFRIQGD